MILFYKFILQKTTVFKDLAFFVILATLVTGANVKHPSPMILLAIVSCFLGSRLAVGRYYEYRDIWIEKTESPITIETYNMIDGKEVLIRKEVSGKSHPEILKNIHITYTGILFGYNAYRVLIHLIK